MLSITSLHNYYNFEYGTKKKYYRNFLKTVQNYFMVLYIFDYNSYNKTRMLPQHNSYIL